MTHARAPRQENPPEPEDSDPGDLPGVPAETGAESTSVSRTSLRTTLHTIRECKALRQRNVCPRRDWFAPPALSLRNRHFLSATVSDRSQYRSRPARQAWAAAAAAAAAVRAAAAGRAHGVAQGGSVIKWPSPLNVRKYAYNRSCYRARSGEYQHLMTGSPRATAVRRVRWSVAHCLEEELISR